MLTIKSGMFIRFNEPFFVNINQSKSAVNNYINYEKSKKKDFFSFIKSSPLDFNEFTILDGNVVIDVEAKILNPFRGAGKIRMNLHTDESNSGTHIKGEIIPYNGLYLFTFYMVMGFLVLWSVLVLLVSSGVETLTMLALSWGVFPLVLILIPFWYRRKLRIYRDCFIDILNKNCT
ncbi:hypothetical protein MM213_15510 [Belliella sp. R4-6]|uniref:Positive regulator of sigma(E), RseC/MucC n=1 Tax=Belliella alkalica TaxID=1730871 RepID=A0ABS9VEN8_9BACT|nr:hypothetical protein [Belliella alkalica]MCH7414907.1 hypothetical protein [Belliella alkalica]